MHLFGTVSFAGDRCDTRPGLLVGWQLSGVSLSSHSRPSAVVGKRSLYRFSVFGRTLGH